MSASRQPDAEPERDIRDIEERRARAFVECDIEALEEIMAEDSIHVGWDGTVQTKDEVLAALAYRAIQFELLEIVENNIRCFRDVALAIGTYFNIVRINGIQQPPKYARHIRVYERTGGGWRLVTHQATEAAMQL